MGNIGILKDKLSRRAAARRKKETREKKQAAKRKYMEYYESLPVQKDVVVLEARNGKTMDGNVHYIAEELAGNREYDGLTVYAVAENRAAEERIRKKLSPAAGQRLHFLLLQTEEYYRVMACAGFIVNDSAIRNFFIKKEGQIYLNVWHGTPLKTMGRRVSHEPQATGSVQKNFIAADYLLYPSEYMMDHMIEDYMIDSLSGAKILLGGYPRNAVFFDEEGRGKVRKALGIEDRRVYAYMPTWRPSMMGSRAQEILREMDGALEEDEILYVNIHPLAEEEVDYSSFKAVRPFPAEYETYAFLNAADGLVTDYSSVFYDFAVTGRKIVLYTYDEEEYTETRGLYVPLSEFPFPRRVSAAETLEALREPVCDDRTDFMERYCRYESPDAARLLCRHVFSGQSCLCEREMPHNGLPNVLVFGGDLSPGARTDELMRFLADPGKPPANYCLTFNRRDVNPYKDLLLHLPEGIRYIGRTGRVTLPDGLEKEAEKYRKGKIPFAEYWEKVRPVYALEKLRYYGGMPIDRVVQIPEGRGPCPEASEEELEFSTY